MKRTLVALALLALPLSLAAETRVAPGSSVFIEPTENGMHIALTAALSKKKIPLTVTTNKDTADYIISVVGDYKGAGFGKQIMLGGGARGEAHASITVAAKDGTVAYAYNVDKGSAVRGLQSAAEACAKHLGEHIKGKE